MNKTNYVVNCIEHGEEFYFVMASDKTNEEDVKEEARLDAMLWGAEVLSIEPTKLEVS